MTSPAGPLTPGREPAGPLARADRVGLFAAVGITLLLAVMLARVVQLQVAPSARLLEQRQARVSTRTELPVRGDILDRRGRPLAVTSFGWRIYLDPVNLKPDKVDTTISSLAKATSRPEEEVGERVIWALEENTRRSQILGGAAPTPARPPPTEWLLSAIGVDVHKADDQDESQKPADLAAQVAARLAEQDVPPVVIDPVSGLKCSPIDFGNKPLPPAILLPIRYLPFKEVIDDGIAAWVRKLKMPGVYLQSQDVREPVGGPQVAAIVGRQGTDANIGMEEKLNDRLSGKLGHVSYVRDALNRPLFIEPGQVQLPVHGEDVRLSIDLELQSMGLEELQRGIEECDAAGGRLVSIDPMTGEILAMCDIVRDMPALKEYPWEDDPKALKAMGQDPARRLPFMAPRAGSARYRTIRVDEVRQKHPELSALARNRCVEDVYEPGSTFKPFVWSTITELGLARIDEVIDTESGRWITPYGRKLNDVTKRDTMSWGDVLVNSSNIGMAKVVERLSHKQLHDLVQRFGFGRVTGLGAAGEASGIVTSLRDWTIYSQTSYAIGHEVAVTPLQMVRAFSAFARSGEFAGTLVDLRLTAPTAGDDGPTMLYRVLPARIAELTRQTMRGVAEHMQESLQLADHSQTGWKYIIFGKSGTAEIPLGKPPAGKRRPAGSTGYYDDQYNSSFIAGGPIETPRLVTIVVIDDPGPELVFARPLPRHYGAKTAGPVVRRFMERALTYLGAPPSFRDQDAKVALEPAD